MTRTTLNDRDYQILEQMKVFHIMTNKCASIYFEGKNPIICASRRLKKLYELKSNINRYRENVTSEYIYYYGKRRGNYKHDLVRLEAYTMLKQNTQIKIIKYKLEKEFIINNTKVRCDLCLVVKNLVNNQIIPILLEVDLSHRHNTNKYKDLDYNKYFGGTKPLIISVGRFAPTTDDVLFIKLDEIEKLKELVL